MVTRGGLGSFALLLVLTAALVHARSPDASGATSRETPDLAIAQDGGRSVGGGVIDPTGRTETIRSHIPPGKTRRFIVVVSNSSSTRKSFVVSGTGSRGAFAPTYREYDGTDITPQVIGPGYVIDLGAHRTAYIHLVLRSSPDATTGAQAKFVVRGATANDSSLADAVKATVMVPPLRVWAVTFNGVWRCTATFPRWTLTPGRKTGVSFTLTNLTGRARWYPDVYGYLLFKDSEGHVVADSRNPYEGIGIVIAKIRPHATVRVGSIDAQIRWSVAEVKPICRGLRLHMPDALLPVVSPGPPSSVAEAIDMAVSYSGSPFEACHPGPNGEPGKGSFDTPDGRALPPMTLRCWADVREEDGFDVVGLNMVGPSDGPDVTLKEDEPINDQLLPPTPLSLEAARWSFVVTSRRARPYMTLTVFQTASEGHGREYVLDRGNWTVTRHFDICGWAGDGVDLNGRTFTLEWVSGCSGSRPATRHLQRIPARWEARAKGRGSD